MFTSYGHLTQADDIAPNSVVIIPLAAMESHGPHLPLSTDGIIVDGLLERAAEFDTTEAPIYCLPTLWLGASMEHVKCAGTLSIEPELLIAQIISIGEGLASKGVSRVVLFNAHGGNASLSSIATLKLRTEFNMLAASIHWLDFGLPKTMTPPASAQEDVHGGWIETSILLHLTPEHVKESLAAANPPSSPAPCLFPKGSVSWGWEVNDLSSGGWVGRPDLADAALGSLMVDHAARRLCDVVAELATAKWPVDP